MPDEILKELIGVFVLHNTTSSFDDVARILNEGLSVLRQLVHVDGFSIPEVRQHLVDLGVTGYAALPEGLNNAV